MNVRKIEIYINLCDSRRRFQVVDDDSFSKDIKCAYDLTKNCSPECATCRIWGSSKKASCDRVGEGFDIGSLE